MDRTELFDFKRIYKSNLHLVFAIFLLMTVGSIAVFSTTFSPEKNFSDIFISHFTFYILGVCVFFLASAFNKKIFTSEIFIALFLILILSLLVYVLIDGQVIYGARRWIIIFDITIQPSELAKLCIILLSGFILGSERIVFKNSSKINNFFGRNLLLFGLIMPLIFLIFLQKSLGNTVLTTGIYILLLFSVIKFNKKFILYSIYLGLGVFCILYYQNLYALMSLILLTTVLSVFIYVKKIGSIKVLSVFFILPVIMFLIGNYIYTYFLEDYQRDRISSYLNPSEDLLDENWNRTQSIRAIGSGQVFGKGFLKGNITNSNLLPFPYTDFIFASLGEQFGFIGLLILISIYIYLFSVIINISSSSNNPKDKIICIGVVFLILLNFIQHAGMNLGLLPISGVPLPLISSGGSSILTVILGLSIVNTIYIDSIDEKVSFVKIKG